MKSLGKVIEYSSLGFIVWCSLLIANLLVILNVDFVVRALVTTYVLGRPLNFVFSLILLASLLITFIKLTRNLWFRKR